MHGRLPKPVVEYSALSRLPVMQMAHRHVLLAVVLGIGDVAVIVAAFMAMNALMPWNAAAPWRLIAIVLVAYLSASNLLGAYCRDVVTKPASSAARGAAAIIAAGLMSALILLIIGKHQHVLTHAFPPAVLLSATLATAVRMIASAVMTLRFGPLPQARVLLCEPHDGDPIVPATALNVTGIFDPENGEIGDYQRLASILQGAELVLIRCAPHRRRLWVDALGGMNVGIEIEAPELADVNPVGAATPIGAPIILARKSPLGIRDRFGKRVFDIAIATAAVMLIMPFLLVVALAIKLDSPGPVLFRQPRIGRQNRVFSIYKFRSMAADMCDVAGSQSTGRTDKRVTRVGRFIRKTSIDELPQLFNVLRGDMSIVGPRPHAISSTAAGKLFWEVDGRYWSRHSCKPGITGLAQVNGYRGATERAEDLINRVSSDLDYALRWSFTADLKIILRTCRILIHDNAY